MEREIKTLARQKTDFKANKISKKDIQQPTRVMNVTMINHSIDSHRNSKKQLFIRAKVCGGKKAMSQVMRRSRFSYVEEMGDK